ncbi:MAG: hypothetical protein U0457_05040 [Candidatus Sericytochromatia bacterium]
MNKKLLIFLTSITFLISCNIVNNNNISYKDKNTFKIKGIANTVYSGLMPINDVIVVALNSKAKEYKFYGVSGQQIKITQKSITNQNCYLQLYDSAGSILSSNSGTNGIAEINFTLTSTGMHSVVIGSDVNTSTGVYQVSINGAESTSHPVVAVLPNDYLWDQQGFPTTQLSKGDFVVAWQKYTPTTGWDIYARLYNANGSPKAPEFLVNSTTVGDQINPFIAINQSGYFTIVWEGNGIGDNSGIFMQRFYPNASKYDPYYEERVNSFTDGIQSNPSVVMGENLSTAIFWQTNGASTSDYNGIWLGRFSHYSLGLETKVNQTLTGNHLNPKSSMNSSGEIVTTWQYSDNTNNDIYYRKYRLYDTNYSTNEVIANQKKSGICSNPDSAVFIDGKYALTWQVNGSSDNSDGIYTRFFTTSDANLGFSASNPEFLVNQSSTNDNSYPVISSNQQNGISKDNFVISWMGFGLGDNTGIFRRMYNISSPTPIGSEYRTNLLTDGVQERPAVALSVNSTEDNPNNISSYSKFVQIWKARNTFNSVDGIYVTMIRSNNQNIYNEFRVDQKENNGSEPAGLIPLNDIITVPYHSGIESGFISKPKEYKFYGVSGQPVRIKQKGINSNDCYIQLFNPNGTLVSENKNLSGLASINTTLNMTGMWKIKVNTDAYLNSNVIPNGVYQVSINADEGNSHPVVAVMPQDYLWDQQGFPTTQLLKGDFIVAWQKYSPTTGWDVYARLYNANGSPKAPEFLVNSTTVGDQLHPSISINKFGYFTIVWEGNGIGDNSGIFMQRFYPNASKYDPYYEERVNSFTDGIQSNPSVVMGENLSTAIFWQTNGASTSNYNGIWLGRFSHYSLGTETQVNGVLTGTNTNPKASINSSGEIAVAWQASSANDNYDVHYKRYNLYNLNYSTGEAQANYYVNGLQLNPDIVINDNNTMAMTWQTNGSLIGLDGIYVRLLNIPDYYEPEFKINITNSNDLSYPAISLNLENGIYKNNFLVSWMGNGSGDDTGIYGRIYNIISGYSQSSELRFNNLLNGSQERPSIAFNVNSSNDSNLNISDPNYSKFLTVWQTRNSTDNTDGIYALRSRNSLSFLENEKRVNINTSISGTVNNN